MKLRAPRRRSVLSLTGAALAVTLLGGGGGCVRGAAPPGTAGSSTGNGPSPAELEAERRLVGIERADLLGPRGMGALVLEGDTQKVTVTNAPIQGQPFPSALRAVITESSGSEWGVQLVAANALAVEKDDAILTTFYLRGPAPPEGATLAQTEFVFELGRAPYSKSVHYPVQVGPEWTKVQIRFKAAQAYAAGEAHMIFRLGYEPETLELGGLTIESFGKRVPVASLPSTEGPDRGRESAARAAAYEAEKAAANLPPVNGGELAIRVSPGKVIRPISPLVYGINAQKAEDSGATLRRLGGNRATGYNWETNASNAGNDYHHNSDEWGCTVLGFHDCDVPAAQMVDFAAENRQAAPGRETILTIPMVDYVTGDKKGMVKESEQAPSPRWVRSAPRKPGPFAATPDLGDGIVYQDEAVNYLIGKLGKAEAGGVRYYALDNEPALWPSTHPRIHPGRTTYAEMLTRTEATADAITRVDPGAMILGGVMFGWSELMSLNEAPDFKAENDKLGAGATYIDVLLAHMKRLERVHHRRLMHALDVHWYPEAKGARRITERDTSPKTVAARLQAPRSLWDPTYLEKSWIAATWGKPIRLIPWLRERIAERYPGTKLAITEYDYGAGDHISGGLAQADALGVFGREGVELATYWGDGAAVGKLPKYIKAAFQLYRNYDGKDGRFGDTAVLAMLAAPADQEKASVFAAVDSKHLGALTILVINKAPHASFEGKVAVVGAASSCKSARVFGLDASSAAIKPLPPAAAVDGAFAYHLPPSSATLFVCEGR